MGENLLKQLKWNNIKIFRNGIYKNQETSLLFYPLYRKRRQLNNIMMNLNQSLKLVNQNQQVGDQIFRYYLFI